MAEITFEWDSRDLSFWRGGKTEIALGRALLKAGNDAVRALKRASTRSVRERKRMKLSKINKGLPLSYPKGREINSLAWTMRVSGAAVPVADFPYRQNRQGVSALINAGKRSMIRSAFVATMKSGHKGVYFRRGKARLPIDEVFTSKLSDVFKDRGMVPEVFEHSQDVFSRSLSRLLPLELKKLR